MKYKSIGPLQTGQRKITKQPRRHLRFPLQCRLLNCTLLENLSDAAITKLYTLYSIYVTKCSTISLDLTKLYVTHALCNRVVSHIQYSEIYPKVSKSVPILGVE